MDDDSKSHPPYPALLEFHFPRASMPERSQNRGEDQAGSRIPVKLGRIHAKRPQNSSGEAVVSLPSHDDRTELGSPRASRLHPSGKKLVKDCQGSAESSS